MSVYTELLKGLMEFAELTHRSDLVQEIDKLIKDEEKALPKSSAEEKTEE